MHNLSRWQILRDDNRIGIAESERYFMRMLSNRIKFNLQIQRSTNSAASLLFIILATNALATNVSLQSSGRSEGKLMRSLRNVTAHITMTFEMQPRDTLNSSYITLKFFNVP